MDRDEKRIIAVIITFIIAIVILISILIIHVSQDQILFNTWCQEQGYDYYDSGPACYKIIDDYTIEKRALCQMNWGPSLGEKMRWCDNYEN